MIRSNFLEENKAVRDAASFIYFNRFALNCVEEEISSIGNTKWYLPEFSLKFSNLARLKEKDADKKEQIGKRDALIREIEKYKKDIAKEVVATIDKANSERNGKFQNFEKFVNSKAIRVKQSDLVLRLLGIMDSIEKKTDRDIVVGGYGCKSIEIFEGCETNRLRMQLDLTWDEFKEFVSQGKYQFGESQMPFKFKYPSGVTYLVSLNDRNLMALSTHYENNDNQGSASLHYACPIEMLRAYCAEFPAADMPHGPGYYPKAVEAFNNALLKYPLNGMNWDATEALLRPYLIETEEIVSAYNADYNETLEKALHDDYGLSRSDTFFVIV